MAMEPEKIDRFRDTDDLIGARVNEDGQQARRTCMVYECYLELDVSDDGDEDAKGVSQLYKVTKVGNVVLDKEPVDRKPEAIAAWRMKIAFSSVPASNAPSTYSPHQSGSVLVKLCRARPVTMR